MNNKELINISIKALNKNNEDKIEYEDLKKGEKFKNLNYNEGAKFIFDLIIQLKKLSKKKYILKTKLEIKNIIKINNIFLIVNYENFIKKERNTISEKNIYKIVSELCIKLMNLKQLEEIKPTKLYYMLKRMRELDNMNENKYFYV